MTTDAKYNGYIPITKRGSSRSGSTMDEGAYSHWQARARKAWASFADVADRAFPEQTQKDATASALSRALEESHEEERDQMTRPASVYTDLLNAALGRVNWYEVAETRIEDEDLEEASK